MRKNLFCLLLTAAVSLTCMGAVTDVSENTASQDVTIILQAGYFDPTLTNKPLPRAPRARKTITLEGTTLSFSPFGSACNMTIVDLLTGETVYQTTITETDTTCEIPSLEESEYMIRFTSESCNFWGVF